MDDPEVQAHIRHDEAARSLDHTLDAAESHDPHPQLLHHRDQHAVSRVPPQLLLLLLPHLHLRLADVRAPWAPFEKNAPEQSGFPDRHRHVLAYGLY